MMLKLLILGLGLLSLTQAWKTYRGYRTYKVTPHSEEQLLNLRTLLSEDIELDVWKESRGVGHEAHVMVSPQKRLQFVELMVTKGLSLDIHVDDVGDDVAAFKARRDAKRNLNGGMVFDLNEYNTVEDTNDQLYVWQSMCPNGITCGVNSIGSGDVTTFMFSMESAENNPKIYIDSLTHAREMLTGSTVNNIINKMVTEYEEDSTVRDLVDRYNWYFVPIVNPNGYQYALDSDPFWRKNREPNPGSVCIGTDLNRNFDTGFWGQDGTSSNPCSDTYGGSAAASSPETTYVQNWLNQNSPRIMISIHAYANMWLQPYGHNSGGSCARSDEHVPMLEAGTAAIRAIEEVGLQNWVAGTVCETIYAASGGTVDYAHARAGSAYSYTPELRGNSFNPPTSQIEPAFLETWAGIVALIGQTE